MAVEYRSAAPVSFDGNHEAADLAFIFNFLPVSRWWRPSLHCHPQMIIFILSSMLALHMSECNVCVDSLMLLTRSRFLSIYINCLPMLARLHKPNVPYCSPRNQLKTTNREAQTDRERQALILVFKECSPSPAFYWEHYYVAE